MYPAQIITGAEAEKPIPSHPSLRGLRMAGIKLTGAYWSTSSSIGSKTILAGKLKTPHEDSRTEPEVQLALRSQGLANFLEGISVYPESSNAQEEISNSLSSWGDLATSQTILLSLFYRSVLLQPGVVGIIFVS